MKHKLSTLCLLLAAIMLANFSGHAQAPTLGANYGGGKVGYILQAGDPGYDPTKIKGLIVGPLNVLPTAPWAIDPYRFSFTNVTSSSFGTGAANTAALVNLMGPGNYMAYRIDTATINGYYDWYLPSLDETAKLMPNRIYWIPGTSPTSPTNRYWTSTESRFNNASNLANNMSYQLIFGFPSLTTGNSSKDDILFPLPVRSFTYNPCATTYSTSTITNCGSYTWNGTTYTASGTYATTLTNAGGCDSIATLNLTITQAPGCVTSGLKIWVKANQGFAYTTTADTAGWADVSGNGNDAKVQSGEPGSGLGNPGATINFNPAVDFDGNFDLYYFDYLLSAGYSMFGVSKQYDFSSPFQRIFSAKNTNFLMGNWNQYEDNIFINGSPSQLFITPQTSNVKLHDFIRQTDGAFKFQKNGLTLFSGAASDGTPIQPTLGGSGQLGEYASAYIPEYIAYDTALTTTEQQKVESYLAVKYGITLGNQASPYDYLASDGSVVWSGSSTYFNNITVIGRDDNSTLSQKQSTAVNGGKITIALGDTIAADNASNTATFGADKSFLAIASNGASGITSITGVSSPTRSSEVWKVKETNGDIGNLTVKVIDTTVYKFLLVSTTENFSAGTVTEYALNSNKEVTVNLNDGSYFSFGTNCIATSTTNATACDQYTINGTTYNTSGVYQLDTIYNAIGCDSLISLNLTIYPSASTTTASGCGSYTWNGSTYTTSGTYSTTVVNPGGCVTTATLNLTMIQAPGCVANGLKIWVKANQGFTYATTADTAGWADASGNGNNAKLLSGEPGTGSGNPGAMINFNPAIDFDGSDDLYYFDYALSAGYSMFGVSKQYDFSTEFQRIFSDKNSNFLMGNWNRFEDNLFMNGTPAELFITPQTTNVKLHDLIRQTDGAYSFNKNGLSVSSGSTSDGTAIQPTLGGSGQFGEFAFAHIPEYIGYDTALTTIERQKVESYLAVKYGLTLGSQASPYDYLASDGSVIWTGNSTYYNNITVIGRDDNSALAQKQTTAVNGGKITISLGNTIAADNASNTATFGADKRFLAIASNGASGSVAVTGVTGPTRSAEVWKVSETNGDNGNVTIKVTESPVYQYLLVSTTENFTAGSVTEYALNNNKEVTVNLIDGSYFALGTNCILNRTISATACDQYTYNGSNYNTTGVYPVDTIYNASGCDSVILLNLTINQSSVPSVTTVANCNAYTWHGQSYINVGTYTWTGTNAAGCDSIEILNVVSNSALTLGQDFQGGKIGYILQPGDPGYDSSLVKGLIVAPELTAAPWAIPPYEYTPTNVTTDGLGEGAANTTALVNLMGPGDYMAFKIDTSTINGYSDWYMPSGAEMLKLLSNWTYWYPVLSNTQNVGPYATSTEVPTMYFVMGIVSSYSGQPQLALFDKPFDHLPSLPVRSFAVTPAQASISTTTVATCGPYTWHGQTYDSVGTYTWTSTTTAGCDSIEILNLVTPASLTIGQTLQGGKIGYVLQPGDPGYDSTKIKGWILGPVQSNRPWAIGAAQTSLINITQNGVGTGAANTAALVNYMGPGNYMAYAIDTATYGGYTDWYMATIDELEKVFDASYTGGNPSLSFAGAYLGFGNKYYMGSANEYDADRVVIWEFSLLDIFHKSNSSNTASALPMRNFEFTIPSGTTTQVSCGSYQWNGNTYTASGTYTSTLQTVLGCDSVATLNLTITSPPSQPTIACYETATLNTTTCTWEVTGTQPAQPSLACYETASFNTTTCLWDVTGSPNAPIVNNATACTSYTWSANGATYTTSGTYQYSSNCQDYTLNLIITPITSVTASVTSPILCNGGTTLVNVVVAGGTPPYYDNGIQVAAAGTWSYTVSDANGCTAISNPVVVNEPVKLQVSVNSTAAACGQNNGTATATVSGGVAPYVYSWSDGSTVSSLTSLSDNTYLVTVTDANGCTSTSSTVITSSGLSVGTTGSIQGPAGACRGTVLTYSLPVVSNANTYNWTLPAGATGSSTSNSITVNFSSNYNGGFICVTPSNSCGSGTESCINVPVITVKPRTPASISGPLNPCGPGTYTYTVTPVNNATSYVWSVSSTLASITAGQGTNSIQVTTASGLASTQISVYASNCIGSSGTLTRTYFGAAVISSPLTGNTYPCPGTTGTYSIDNIPGATNYSWSVSGNASIASQNGTSCTIAFTSNWTGGTLTATATNSCGSTNRNYTLYSNPLQPGGISGVASALCPAEGVNNATFSIAPVAGATSYTWTVPTGMQITSNSGSTPNLTVNINNNYIGGNVCVSANNACGLSTARCLITTNKPATPGTIAGPTAVCKSQTAVIYSVAPVTGAGFYSWGSTGSVILTSQGTGLTAAVNFTTATSSSLQVFVRSNNACGSSSPSNLTVAVNLACRVDATTGQDQLSVYPNPTSGMLRLTTPDVATDVRLELIGMDGRKVIQTVIPAHTTESEFSLTGIASGLYQLMYQDGVEVRSLKVIVQ